MRVAPGPLRTTILFLVLASSIAASAVAEAATSISASTCWMSNHSRTVAEAISHALGDLFLSLCSECARLHYRRRPISEKLDVAERPPAFHPARYSAYGFYASRQWRCSAHRQAAERPLWVISGHRKGSAERPLNPRKRTSLSAIVLGLHVIAQPVDRGLNAALAVRDTERAEPGLDDPQRAEHHRRINMAHMGNAKRFAVHRPEPAAKDHSAFAVAILAQGIGVEAVGHQHCGHRLGTFGGFDDVEVDDVALLPHRNGAADRLGQEVMTAEGIVEAFGEQHVERLAQRKHQMHRRGAGIFLIVRLAVAHAPVPIGRAQTGLAVGVTGALAGGDKAEPGRCHQSLLRSRHGDINAPGVHREGRAA